MEEDEIQYELFPESDTTGSGDLQFETDAVSGAPEREDGEEDKIERKGGLASYVRERFNRAEKKKQFDEKRALMAYRNFRGIYGPETQFREEEKSRVFIKISKTKTLAAFGQAVDVMFGNHSFPLTVEPTELPDGIVETAHMNIDPNSQGAPAGATERPTTNTAYRFKETGEIVPQELVKGGNLGWLEGFVEPIRDKIVEGPGTTATQVTFHPAMMAAKKMQKKIHDQLEESNASAHLRKMAFEMCMLGTGIIKGPFLEEKEYPNWEFSEDGTSEYKPLIKTVPKITSVSFWNFYPDPDADNQDEMEYAIERQKLSATDLRALKRRPFYRKETIESVIEDGPNYVRLDWETQIEEEENYNPEIERYEILDFWGYVDTDTLKDFEVEIPEEMEDMPQINCNVVVCGDRVLRVVLNPFKPSRIPFYAVPYEINPYSFFGIGVCENMADTQMLMNGFMRLAVDNAVLSGNLVFEIDAANLKPNTDMKIYPGKIFERQGGAPGQSIFATSFPNVSKENMELFNMSRMLADESTGIPSYSHGETNVQNVGRTASGISMLMSAANQTIKTVIKNLDDYLLGPLGRAFFHFNMQFDPDPTIKGDLEVKARGTESLMANEVRSQRLMQFLGIVSSNPMTAPFGKIDYIMREIAKSLDLDPDKVANNMADAAVQAEILKKMGPPQQDPAFLAQQAAMKQQPGMGSPRQDGSMPVQQGPGTATPTERVPGADAMDPTGQGGGSTGVGMAPVPGTPGFSGGQG